MHLTQPNIYHCLCHRTGKQKPLENPKCDVFENIEVGTVVIYRDERVVKITASYFNIYNEKSFFVRSVNAMIEHGGKLIEVPSGMCVLYADTLEEKVA